MSFALIVVRVPWSVIREGGRLEIIKAPIFYIIKRSIWSGCGMRGAGRIWFPAGTNLIDGQPCGLKTIPGLRPKTQANLALLGRGSGSLRSPLPKNPDCPNHPDITETKAVRNTYDLCSLE